MSTSRKVLFFWPFQEQSSTNLPGQTTICSLLPSRQSCSPGETVRKPLTVESHQMSNQKTSVTGGLIPLPRDYTDLMNLAAAFTCPNNVSGPSAGEVGGNKFFNSKWVHPFPKVKSPALCLICGMMVCSQSACCETVINGWEHFSLRLCNVHESVCKVLWGCISGAVDSALAEIWYLFEMYCCKEDMIQISNMSMDATKSRINCTIHSVNVSTVLPLAQLMFLSPGRNAVVVSLTPDNALQTLGFSSGGLLIILWKCSWSIATLYIVMRHIYSTFV